MHNYTTCFRDVLIFYPVANKMFKEHEFILVCTVYIMPSKMRSDDAGFLSYVQYKVCVHKPESQTETLVGILK